MKTLTFICSATLMVGGSCDHRIMQCDPVGMPKELDTTRIPFSSIDLDQKNNPLNYSIPAKSSRVAFR